ncbi:MAG: ATP-binding cassette domain-containing protein, partial [Betaproteobacteria bacterium]
MQAVLNLSEHTWVLNNGQLIAEGKPADDRAEQRLDGHRGSVGEVGIDVLEILHVERPARRHQPRRNHDRLELHAEHVHAERRGRGFVVAHRRQPRAVARALQPPGEGRDITRARHTDIVAAGLIQVPEGRRVFPNLSVRENLELGSYRRGREHRARNMERVFSVFPRLQERTAQRAGTLSGGEQQMLAIGRALMAEPRLLILDEPSLGLSPMRVDEMFSLVKRLNAEGLSILLVEQNVGQALEIAHRAYVLENGAMTFHGT